MMKQEQNLLTRGEQPLNGAQAKAHMEDLQRCIEAHNRHYYAEDSPRIEDGLYDQLWSQLLHLEERYPALRSADSPTRRPGGEVMQGFSKCRHKRPMLSLDNVHDEAALQAFFLRLKNRLKTASRLFFWAEPKIDGIAINLLYRRGSLQRAATRGDGVEGEVVTANIRTIASIPQQLQGSDWPAEMEIRGEVYMPKAAFSALNQSLQSSGQRLFANPRNAAAGSLRQLDAAITAQRALAFFAYSLHSEEPLWSQTASIRNLERWGMPVCPAAQWLAEEDCQPYFHSLLATRERLQYEIDGVVYKLDCGDRQRQLGVTSRAPRFSVAYKFPPRQLQTVIEQVVFQVGRSGVLTPVAQLRPTDLAGVVVRRASLHNMRELRRKDVRVGDTVLLQRAGDVIPEVVEVVLSCRPSSAIEVAQPLHCPACQAVVEVDEDAVAIRCGAGLQCVARRQEAIWHFASRPAMNIEGLGEKVIQQLLADGLIQRAADLYALTAHQLETLPGFAARSAAKLLAALAGSKHCSLGNFLYALGIAGVGVVTASSMARHFGRLQNVMAATIENLCAVHDVGPVVAAAIYDFFRDAERLTDVQALLDAGVICQETIVAQQPLTGRRYVLTGRLEGIDRKQAEAQLRAHGAVIGSQVTADTTALFAGEKAGQKLSRARQLGIPVLDQQALGDLLADNSDG